MVELSVGEIGHYLTRRFVVNVWLPLFLFVVAGVSVVALALGVGTVLAIWEAQSLLTQIWVGVGVLLLVTFCAYVFDNLLDSIVRVYEGYWPTWMGGFLMAGQYRRAQYLKGRMALVRARRENVRQILKKAQKDVTATPNSMAWADLQGPVAQFQLPLHQKTRSVQQSEWERVLDEFNQLRANILGANSVAADWRQEQEKRLQEKLISHCQQELMRQNNEYNSLYATQYFTYPKKQAMLPTRLGNILRASEEYSLLAYNLDAAVVWPRLVPNLPEAYLARLDQSSTPLTTMLFSSFLSFLFALIMGSWLALTGHSWPLFWAVIISGVLLALGFYESALLRAVEYGLLVRTAFDLYRKELLNALDISLPLSPQEERKQWKRLKDLWYFHNPSINSINSNPPPSPPPPAPPPPPPPPLFQDEPPFPNFPIGQRLIVRLFVRIGGMTLWLLLLIGIVVGLFNWWASGLPY